MPVTKGRPPREVPWAGLQGRRAADLAHLTDERQLVASGGRRRSSSRGGGWTTRLQPLAEHGGRRGGSLGAFWPHPVACEPPRR